MYLIYWSIFANYQPDKSKNEIILNIFKSGGGGYPKLSAADETKSFLATSSSITISDISHAFLWPSYVVFRALIGSVMCLGHLKLIMFLYLGT